MIVTSSCSVCLMLIHICEWDRKMWLQCMYYWY